MLLNIIILLGAVVVLVPLFVRLGLGSVVGYLVAGVILGPWGIGIPIDLDTTRHVAEFGVVFLLFTIGLELHPSRLWAMRTQVFGMGTLQILVSAALIAGYSLSISEIELTTAIMLGLALSLSSTAIVLQTLAEKGEMATKHGQSSFSILLMQDMAVVPLIALIPILAGKQDSTGDPVYMTALWIGIALIGVFIGVRFVLRPALSFIARQGYREVFTATVVFAVLLAAWNMEQVHMSAALGGFLVGLLLSDSEHVHQLEAQIEPFRGFLLGLFFIIVGMSIDWELLGETGPHFMVHVVVILTLKSLVLYILARLFRHTHGVSLRIAFLMPQAGEFGFVLFSLAYAMGIPSPSGFQLAIVLIAITMALTPLLNIVGERLARVGESPMNEDGGSVPKPQLENQALIIGFGRMGRVVATLLRSAEVLFMAVDPNPSRVKEGRANGYSVYAGDPSSPNLMGAVGIGKFRVFIIALDDAELVEKTIQNLHYMAPSIPIVARAKDMEHALRLEKLGVTRAIPDTLEASLQLSQEGLYEAGIEDELIKAIISAFRTKNYTAVREQLR